MQISSLSPLKLASDLFVTSQLWFCPSQADLPAACLVLCRFVTQLLLGRSYRLRLFTQGTVVLKTKQGRRRGKVYISLYALLRILFFLFFLNQLLLGPLFVSVLKTLCASLLFEDLMTGAKL